LKELGRLGRYGKDNWCFIQSKSDNTGQTLKETLDNSGIETLVHETQTAKSALKRKFYWVSERIRGRRTLGREVNVILPT